MSEQVQYAVEHSSKSNKQYEQIEKEKKQLFDKCFSVEETLSDKQRECELKDIKIESLENILNKREPIFQSVTKSAKKLSRGDSRGAKTTEKSKQGVDEKVRRLETEMDGLLEQLETLTKENGKLAKKAKDCEALEHLKQTREKNMEI